MIGLWDAIKGYKEVRASVRRHDQGGGLTFGRAVQSSGSGSVHVETGKIQDQQKMEEVEPIQVKGW